MVGPVRSNRRWHMCCPAFGRAEPLRLTALALARLEWLVALLAGGAGHAIDLPQFLLRNQKDFAATVDNEGA